MSWPELFEHIQTFAALLSDPFPAKIQQQAFRFSPTSYLTVLTLDAGMHLELTGGSLASWWWGVRVGEEGQGLQSGRIIAESPSNPTMGGLEPQRLTPNEKP